MPEDIPEPPRRYRPVPIPIPVEDRYLNPDRPLRKVELMKIRDNLDELVDIKTELINKDSTHIDSKNESKENLKSDQKNEINIESKTEPVETKNNNQIDNSKIELNKESLSESKTKEDTKLNSKLNLKLNEKLTNKIYNDKVDNDKVDNKNINKINTVNDKTKQIKRKVKYMGTEDEVNISPEDRRRMRRADYQELKAEEETNAAIKKAAELAEQNDIRISELNEKLSKENEELKKTFASRFEQLDGKFANQFTQFDGKIGNIGQKLEKTCEGIDCLKNDFAGLNKKLNVELTECSSCGKVVIPYLASFCPNCSAKVHGWADDNGIPIKGWKPSWKNEE